MVPFVSEKVPAKHRRTFLSGPDKTVNRTECFNPSRTQQCAKASGRDDLWACQALSGSRVCLGCGVAECIDLVTKGWRVGWGLSEPFTDFLCWAQQSSGQWTTKLSFLFESTFNQMQKRKEIKCLKKNKNIFGPFFIQIYSDSFSRNMVFVNFNEESISEHWNHLPMYTHSSQSFALKEK